MPEHAVEDEEVLMVEEVPGNMDTTVAKEIAARGGYVHREEGTFRAYLPIRRAFGFFEKLFRRATEQPPPK